MARRTAETPQQLGIERVLKFLGEHLRPRARVLEVGCGDGGLAHRMRKKGYQVVAIDRSEKMARRARDQGVEVLHQDFLEYSPEKGRRFDAVLFTRSLHHIHHLREAIQRSADLLVPRGRILLDEFAVTRMDRSTANWFYDTVDALRAAGTLEAPDHWHPPVEDRRERWRAYHVHHPPLHSDSRMLSALERSFLIERVERVPLLFRYLVDRVPADREGLDLTLWLEQREIELIRQGRVRPLGLRVVARKK